MNTVIIVIVGLVAVGLIVFLIIRNKEGPETAFASGRCRSEAEELFLKKLGGTVG